jgi:hypothetical protein
MLMNALAKPPKDSGLKGDAWTGLIVSSFLRKRCGIKLTARHCNRLVLALKNQTKI